MYNKTCLTRSSILVFSLIAEGMWLAVIQYPLHPVLAQPQQAGWYWAVITQRRDKRARRREVPVPLTDRFSFIGTLKNIFRRLVVQSVL